MGATATLSFVESATDRDTITRAVQHGSNRFSAEVGPHSTILTGPDGLGSAAPLKTVKHLWFRDRQFIFTFYQGVM